MATVQTDRPLPTERTILGFRVSFLWGALVGALFTFTVLTWSGVVSRALADPCRPTRSLFAQASAVALDFEHEPESIDLGGERGHDRAVRRAEH